MTGVKAQKDKGWVHRRTKGGCTEGQRMGAQKDKGWVHRRTKDGCTEGQRVGAQKDKGGRLSFCGAPPSPGRRGTFYIGPSNFVGLTMMSYKIKRKQKRKGSV